MLPCTKEERILLVQMAEMRADQMSWETISQKTGRSVPEMRALKTAHFVIWKRYLAQARREWVSNLTQEAMLETMEAIKRTNDLKPKLQAVNLFARLAHTIEKLTGLPKPKRTTKASDTKNTPTPVEAKKNPTPPTTKPLNPVPRQEKANAAEIEMQQKIEYLAAKLRDPLTAPKT